MGGWHSITAAAFRDWLAAQSEAPSAHIRAWFDAHAPAVSPDVEESQRGECALPKQTKMKRAAVLQQLGRKYQKLESAMDHGDGWVKACRVPDARGFYYLEKVEAGCKERWSSAAPATVGTSAVAQLKAVAG